MLLTSMELSQGNINAVKYTLRTKSILKRIESERTRHHNTSSKKKESKDKEKPAPLSKYRRKTANARERNRMKEINDAFVSLQSSLPDIPGTDADKLTKITVLKLAVNYISALTRVLDSSTPCMDVEDVREMWCHDNAHITKNEPCMKSITNKNTSNQSPTKKLVSKETKTAVVSTTSRATSVTTKKQRQPGTQKAENKYLHSTLKPNIKKPSGKSRTRGKVCRTNSVATNNGAYITLKNCAIQTTHNPRARAINNQPLMMSMTVKRTRIEPIAGHRSIKMRKYEPQLSYGTTELAQFNPIASPRINRTIISRQKNNKSNRKASSTDIYYENNNNQVVNSSFKYQLIDPQPILSPQKTPIYDRLSHFYNSENIPQQPHQQHINPTVLSYTTNDISNSPLKSNYYQPVTTTSNNMPQYLSVQTNFEGYPMCGLATDLKSPPLKNDVLLDFPPTKQLSPAADSAFSPSSESARSSPNLSLESSCSPQATLEDLSSPLGSLSSSLTSSSAACSISIADCDNVFNSLLLDSGPFQEELDHFASVFNCADVTNNRLFNSFAEQQHQQQQPSPTYMNCNINGF